jgi:predicted Zn-dependent peptidase
MNSEVQRIVLDNGIRIVTERMPFVRSVSVGVWVRAGAIDENVSNNGVSHLLEHMLFKGTKNRTAREIAMSLESLGGGLNGSTGKEITLYTAHVLDEHLPVAVDVLCDLLQNPLFPKKDLALEKNVILAEINHSKEDPEEHLLDNFYKNIFPDHPLGYFILGTDATVSRFKKRDLMLYMQEHYLAERIVFAAAGRVEHEQFVDLVNKYYRFPRRSVPSNGVAALPKQSGGTYRLEMPSLQQSHICMGVRTFGSCDERKYAMILMDVLLGGGMSSRLFQNIREKYGFAYSVYSFSDFLATSGVFGTYMACATDKTDKSVELLREEFEDFKKNPVSTEDLNRVKSQVNGGIILGLESSSRRMKKIGETEVFDRPHLTMEKVLEKIDRVKPDDLQQLAHRFFADSQLCITILEP